MPFEINNLDFISNITNKTIIALDVFVSNEKEFDTKKLKELCRQEKIFTNVTVSENLIETFSDSTFPANTSKMLFSPLKSENSQLDVKVFSSWDEIYNEII